MKVNELLEKLKTVYQEFITEQDIEYIKTLFQDDEIENTIVTEPKITKQDNGGSPALLINLETNRGSIDLVFRPKEIVKPGFAKFEATVNEYKIAPNQKIVSLSNTDENRLQGSVKVQNEFGRWTMDTNTIADEYYCSTLRYLSPEALRDEKDKSKEPKVEITNLNLRDPLKQITAFRKYSSDASTIFERQVERRKQQEQMKNQPEEQIQM